MALTQNYDKFLILGRLTDRKIVKYQKMGFYGGDAKKALEFRDGKRAKIQKERKKKAITIKALLALYD